MLVVIERFKHCYLWFLVSASLLAGQPTVQSWAVDLDSTDARANSVGQRIALLRDGHYAESLVYHCLLFDAFYADDRLWSWRIMASWEKLAAVYPPAEAAQWARLQWLGNGLIAGTEPDVAVVMLARLARALDCPGEVIGIIVAMPPVRQRDTLMSLAVDELIPTWLSLGAYAWVIRYGDMNAYVEKLTGQIGMARRQGLGSTGLGTKRRTAGGLPGGGSLPTGTAATHVGDYAQIYAAFLAGGFRDEARVIASKALALRDHPTTRDQLAWAGYLSGKAGANEVGFARQAWQASGESQAGFANTYARLLWVTGKRAEARRILDEGLRVADRHARPLLLATKAIFGGE